MRIFEKHITGNGRRHFLFCGIKVVSLPRKKDPKISISEKVAGLDKCVIYTCITGMYDDLIQHSCTNTNCHYVCFTDNKKLLKHKKIGVWEIRPLVYDKLDNVRNNRWHKLHPHILFPEYPQSIYVDANIDVINTKLFNDINKLPKKCVLSIPIHFERDCIYDEIDACINQKKDDMSKIKATKRLLQKNNFPKHFGLSENNVIYRKHNDKTCIKLMNQWWNMLIKFSCRDQLSFMYVLWRNKFKMPYLSKSPYRYDKINFRIRGHKQ